MYRTSTTVLLLTALASACAGCVSVAPSPDGRPGGTGPDTPKPRVSRSPAEHVQAPAREALRFLGSPSPSAPPSRPARATPGTETVAPEAPPAPAVRPEPRPRRTLRVPTAALPTSEAELCALGDRTGALAPDSTAARICRQRYGR